MVAVIPADDSAVQRDDSSQLRLVAHWDFVRWLCGVRSGKNCRPCGGSAKRGFTRQFRSYNRRLVHRIDITLSYVSSIDSASRPDFLRMKNVLKPLGSVLG